jgi:Zn-dependent M28 family amino/carboxypeptidase
LFVLFTGEEMGGLGSRHFVQNPPVPLESVRAMVNLEMIGRFGHRPLGTDHMFAIVGTPEGSVLRETVHRINGDGFEYEWEIPDEFMGGSDHTAFERAGIPNITIAGSPPYGTHEDYHRPGDDPDRIEFGAMRKATVFIYQLMLDLANR